MPDGSRIEVRITADVADLQVKMEMARQAAIQAQAGFVDMARQVNNLNPNTPFYAVSVDGLRAVAREAASTKAAYQQLAKEAASAGAGQEGLRLATAGTTQELIRIGHEALTGNFSRIPGSIIVLAERMGSLHTIIEMITPAMAGFGAVALAAAGGIAYYAEQAERARNVTGALVDSFANSDFTATPAQIDAIREALAKIPGASEEVQTRLAHIFQGMSDATPQMRLALASVVPELMRSTGEGAEQLGKMFADRWSKAVLESPTPQAAAQKFADEIQKDIGNLLVIPPNASHSVMAYAHAHEAAAKAAAAWADAVKTAADDATTADARAAGAAEQQTKNEQEWYRVQADLARQGAEARDQAIDKAQEAYREEGEAARKAGEEAIAAAREQASAIAANDQLSAAQRLGFEAQLWGQLLAGDRLNADQRIEVQRTLNQTLAELNRQRVEDTKRAAEEQAQSDEAWVRGAVKIYDEETASAHKAAEENSRVWTGAFSDIDGAMKTFLGDVISRHETVSEAGKQAVQKLVTSWLEGIAEIMAKLMAFEALKALSGVGGPVGSAASAGASALGGNLTASLGPSLAGLLGVGGGGSQMPNSTSDAGAQSVEQLAQAVTQGTQPMQTALGTMGSTLTTSATTLGGMATTAASGFMSLVESAAQQLAALFLIAFKPTVLGTSYDVGSFNVPSTGPAIVHAGEMIIPTNMAGLVRPMFTGAAGGIALSPRFASLMGAPSASGGVAASPSGAIGGGSTNNATMNVTIQALDTQTGASFLAKNLPALSRSMQMHIYNNPSVHPQT